MKNISLFYHAGQNIGATPRAVTMTDRVGAVLIHI